jgi:hypothetical protein
MVLGSPALTFAHVAISLIGIASGFVVVWGLLTSQRLDRWTAVFLISTVATSVTGFIFFPFHGITPGIVIGAISLAVLAVAIVARYPRRMIGAWRPIYVVSAIISLYLNFFVLIVQSFMKVPVLHDLAPTQSEPPFAIAQGAALIVFVALAVASVLKFRDQTVAAN